MGYSLIKKGESYYNIESGILNKLTILEPLSKEDFILNGMTDLIEVSDINEQIRDSKLIFYSEQAMPIVNTKSLPNRQLIKPNKDIQFSLLEKINSITLTSNSLLNGVVRTVFSVDGGEKWLTYNLVAQDFAEINIEDLDSIKERGVKESDFNLIGEKWNDIVTDSRIRFAYYVEIEEIEDTAEIDKLEINMDLTGKWERATHRTDFDYEFDNTNVYIDFKTNGSYKVNYS